MVRKLLAKQETQVQPLGQEDPVEKEMATHSAFLPGKSHGKRNLAGYSPWGHKELVMSEQLSMSILFQIILPHPLLQNIV